ncbi:hypothetical protein [Pedobacter duraquae]|uniref:Outer membrane protein with beta-barrel domain n=1 Tax=Pedobacter duraquae TaxID=425511 RepID=A0A4R6IK71_9SPHI|nr:hypothetical protein [Pedobacter duraquae]TDO22423.1 hypothetical protein CLV32_1396 [Pedobacter duraquae]
MKDNHHKELITEIKEVLSVYEVPYEEGAWEAFIDRPKKKRMLLWPWISVAATLLVVFSFWFNMKQGTVTNHKDQIVHNRTEINKSNDNEQKKSSDGAGLSKGINAQAGAGSHLSGKTDDLIIEAPLPQTLDTSIVKPNLNDASILAAKPELTKMPAVLASAMVLTIKAENPIRTATTETALLKMNSGMYTMVREKAASQTAKLPALKKLTRDTAVKMPEPKTDSFMDLLMKEKQTQVAKTTPKTPKKSLESKWDFGVEVLPTVTSSALNVGAGLLTAYKLSDHFSLGTGVAYTGLGSSVAHQPGISALDSKQLQSVSSTYRAIDIPINLVYNLNKKVYTSVGVSYINVVEERATNTFVSEQRSSYYSSSPSGSSQTSIGFETQKTQESAQTQTLKGMGSLGFFNFSVGRKQEVFNKYHISIEPFIKVPVGKLSQQDLKLTNGGMKFKIEF